MTLISSYTGEVFQVTTKAGKSHQAKLAVLLVLIGIVLLCDSARSR